MRPDEPDEGIDAEKARLFRTKTEILNKRCLWRWRHRVCSANHFYGNCLQYYCATKVIFNCEDDHYFYKLTKNIPINSPVQRKIPAKNVLVDCIHVNWLSTVCQSEGKVLLPVKTKNRVFSAIILYFSLIFL